MPSAGSRPSVVPGGPRSPPRPLHAVPTSGVLRDLIPALEVAEQPAARDERRLGGLRGARPLRLETLRQVARPSVPPLRLPLVVLSTWTRLTFTSRLGISAANEGQTSFRK